MIVVYRFDDLSHSHPLIQVESDPLSRRFRVFLISRLKPFAKVYAPEAGKQAQCPVRRQFGQLFLFATKPDSFILCPRGGQSRIDRYSAQPAVPISF